MHDFVHTTRRPSTGDSRIITGRSSFLLYTLVAIDMLVILCFDLFWFILICINFCVLKSSYGIPIIHWLNCCLTFIFYNYTGIYSTVSRGNKRTGWMWVWMRNIRFYACGFCRFPWKSHKKRQPTGLTRVPGSVSTYGKQSTCTPYGADITKKSDISIQAHPSYDRLMNF